MIKRLQIGAMRSTADLKYSKVLIICATQVIEGKIGFGGL
jgi:hypothetical protein